MLGTYYYVLWCTKLMETNTCAVNVFIRGVNSFLGGSSNAARRRCPAAPSILPKYGGGGNCHPVPAPPFIDAPEPYQSPFRVMI